MVPSTDILGAYVGRMSLNGDVGAIEYAGHTQLMGNPNIEGLFPI